MSIPNSFRLNLFFLLAGTLAACGSSGQPTVSATTSTASVATTVPTPNGSATAIFAGGCFWCMEKPFDQVAGVVSTTSGYTGGDVANPTYHQVGAGDTGHYEAVKIVYDPARVSYKQLLDIYWHQVDPFDGTGQFCDKGLTYRPAIFVATPEERTEAEASKASVGVQLNRSIAVEVLPAKTFWPAEDYHQDYYLKNPIRYAYYRNGCGRDARLSEVWGKKSH